MTCAACGMLFESRRKDHRFCSAKCRLVGFQRKQENERRERDAKVRLLLNSVLGLLEPKKEPSS
jgi:predicted nucleic acid-binding Zn ribbon protein